MKLLISIEPPTLILGNKEILLCKGHLIEVKLLEHDVKIPHNIAVTYTGRLEFHSEKVGIFYQVIPSIILL